MAIVTSSKVVEIAVEQTMQQKPAVNVWHMRWDAEWSSTSIEDIVRDFADNWQDHIVPLQVPSVVLQRFSYRSLDPFDATVGVLLPDPAKPDVGTTAGQGEAINTAVLITKATSTRPRGRRDGRAYVPGLSESITNDDGTLNASGLSAWQAGATALYNGISDTAWNAAGDKFPVVLETTPASRAPGSAVIEVNSRRVTSLQVQQTLATQRERMRR